jgi:2-dehydro-3-deoxygalactonokinase
MRLFDITKEQVLGEVVSDEGISKMHNSWQQANKENGAITKAAFFRQYLAEQVEILSHKTSVDLDHIAIVISGMASSSIGMEEVSYAKLPFALDGSNAVIKHFASEETFPHDLILISGICSENDVMRGEETQLIGLLALLEKSGAKPQKGILIFPGTHSKHIYINEGSMVRFNTFMTGEVFNLVSNHSILKNSIEKDSGDKLSEADEHAFKTGVRKSNETGVLNGLFTVRTNQLFDKFERKQNSFYLSGILIGEELNYLLKDEGVHLFLCSASNLAKFYTMAIEELGLSNRTTIVPAELVDKAALAGQLLMFQRHI